jgi:hypothetical protein
VITFCIGFVSGALIIGAFAWLFVVSEAILLGDIMVGEKPWPVFWARAIVAANQRKHRKAIITKVMDKENTCHPKA